MTEIATETRRSYVNSSTQPVRYPLGNIKVEVQPGETLVFFTSERTDDPFQRARARRKLLQAAAPFLIVLVIVVIAAVMVRFIALRDVSGN